jgi:hypothetical protein
MQEIGMTRTARVIIGVILGTAAFIIMMIWFTSLVEFPDFKGKRPAIPS